MTQANCEKEESKSIAVALVIYDMNATDKDRDHLMKSEVLHGFSNPDDAVDYLDSLEETYRNFHDAKLDITRPNNEQLIVRFSENDKPYMGNYHIETTQIYY